MQNDASGAVVRRNYLCLAAVWTVSCSESIFKGQTGANSPVAPLSALLLIHSD